MRELQRSEIPWRVRRRQPGSCSQVSTIVTRSDFVTTITVKSCNRLRFCEGGDVKSVHAHRIIVAAHLQTVACALYGLAALAGARQELLSKGYLRRLAVFTVGSNTL